MEWACQQAGHGGRGEGGSQRAYSAGSAWWGRCRLNAQAGVCMWPALRSKQKPKSNQKPQRQKATSVGAAQGAAHRRGIREDEAEPDRVVRDVDALACAGRAARLLECLALRRTPKEMQLGSRPHAGLGASTAARTRHTGIAEPVLPLRASFIGHRAQSHSHEQRSGHAPRVSVCLDLSRNLAVGRFFAAGPLRIAKKTIVSSTIATLITTSGSISIALRRLPSCGRWCLPLHGNGLGRDLQENLDNKTMLEIAPSPKITRRCKRAGRGRRRRAHRNAGAQGMKRRSLDASKQTDSTWHYSEDRRAVVAAWAHSGMQGWRPAMEDAVVTVSPTRPAHWSCCPSVAAAVVPLGEALACLPLQRRPVFRIPPSRRAKREPAQAEDAFRGLVSSPPTCAPRRAPIICQARQRSGFPRPPAAQT